MYLTEKELFSQYDALKQTYKEINKKSEEILSFYKNGGYGSITFIGCGSSYSLSKSAALAARLRLGIPSYAFTAGDLLLNFDCFAPVLKNTLLVSISRTGSTSEVIMLAEKAKSELQVDCASIRAKEDAAIGKLSSLDLLIPWAFDESVCQTRCVSNLYLASMMFVGILSDDKDLLQSFENVIAQGEEYIRENKDSLREIAGGSWEKVVVLADAELEGIAEEGALAFNEISLVPSNYYHLLDLRHGPIALVDDKTLVIAALSPKETHLQDALLSDIKALGATLVVFSDRQGGSPHASHNVVVPPQKKHAANGIPFIFLPQALSFFRALASGKNPDTPEGLNLWIKL